MLPRSSGDWQSDGERLSDTGEGEMTVSVDRMLVLQPPLDCAELGAMARLPTLQTKGKMSIIIAKNKLER